MLYIAPVGARRTGVLIASFIVYGVAWSYYQLTGIALISRLASKQNRGFTLGFYNVSAGARWILVGPGSGLVTEQPGYPMTCHCQRFAYTQLGNPVVRS
ncbi:hypothetical protein ACFLS0_02460 [Candidatus Bipolaricaulota bacterium]